MPDFRPIPPGATGPKRSVAPSTSREMLEFDLPADTAPLANKPIVRKTPNPRPRTLLTDTISIDNWQVPAEYVAKDLGFPQ